MSLANVKPTLAQLMTQFTSLKCSYKLHFLSEQNLRNEWHPNRHLLAFNTSESRVKEFLGIASAINYFELELGKKHHEFFPIKLTYVLIDIFIW